MLLSRSLRQRAADQYLHSSASCTSLQLQRDVAIKKSAWLTRRALVLNEGVNQGEIVPMHISERDMLADPFTKYLVYAVWSRHMDYLCNRANASW